MPEQPTNPTRSPRGRKPGAKAWKEPFLQALRNSGIVRAACQAAKVDRSTAYDARDKDDGFRAQWEEAIEDAVDLLEAEAIRRGAQGVTRPIFFQGRQIATVKEYSDTLLIRLLQAHRPEKYRNNVNVQHSGEVKTTVQSELDAEIEKLMEQMASRDEAAEQEAVEPAEP